MFISLSELKLPKIDNRIVAASSSPTANPSHAQTMTLPLQVPTTSNMPILASTLSELMSHHDHNFVQCAYQTLLGRAPDPDGMSYYLSRLRTGFSKIQVLAQIHDSPEGKKHATDVPGLKSAIQCYQRGRLPLIGWLFRQLEQTAGDQPSERNLRAIENQLGLLTDESSRRLTQIEALLAGSRHLVAIQTNAIAIPGSTPTPQELGKLSPHARVIYLQLQSAAAIHARRTA